LTKAILWDMDGVLVNTAGFHFRAWQTLAAELGQEFTEEQFWPTFGRRNSEILHEVFGISSASEMGHLIERKEEILHELLADSRITPMPGVVALLEATRRLGCRQAVASSSPRQNVLTVLRAAGLESYFDAVITAENVTEGKPSPQVFLVAARSLGVAPYDCVVVEDSVAGVQAAKAAGARCIAVTTSRSAPALAAADLVVSSLEQVRLGQIKTLLAGGPASARTSASAPDRS